jgi:hypothetical protein
VVCDRAGIARRTKAAALMEFKNLTRELPYFNNEGFRFFAQRQKSPICAKGN